MKLPESSAKPKNNRSRWPVIIRKIHGHSMVPVLPPGTYVWATPWYKNLKVGDTVIFLHEGREKIKRISEIKEGKLFLLGDHAESSTDSRQFGWLDSDTVLARVFWPHAPRTRAENVDASGQI
jgi:nickel-type superoxide dismutase maturation protease